MKLDEAIAVVNDDLKDLLTPVAARFRSLLAAIFDYAVANPASTAAAAQTAIVASFAATYADGLVSNFTSTQVLTAFINRHGVGGTLALKWISVRDWIVAHSAFRGRVLEAYEEGTLAATESLWLERLAGNHRAGIARPADLVVTEIPSGLNRTVTYSSAALAKTVRISQVKSIVALPQLHVETVETVEVL